MKDWKLVAKGLDLDIPDEEIGSAGEVLDGLERAFRPLVEDIPLELEPAYVLLRLPEEPS